MLHAVLFDLDNTLIDRDRPFRDCVAARFANKTAREELLNLDQRGQGDRIALCNAWQRLGGPLIDPLTLANFIAGRIEPDCGLLEALRSLATVAKLGIITNGSGAGQRAKIRAAALHTVIPDEHIWISAEIGRAKPDPMMFLEASKRLGVLPGHCLHLGDHAPHDLAGARAAGMRARLVAEVLDGPRLCEIWAEESGA